ncbi:WD40 repeat domain-containing protein [Nonomuraea wenchangensis]
MTIFCSHWHSVPTGACWPAVALTRACACGTDPASPRPLGHVLTGHTDAVMSLEFNPNGRVLASAGDSSIRLWDVPAVITSASSITFTPNSRALAVADNGIRLWNISDTATPRPAHRYGRGKVFDVAIAEDGELAVGVIPGKNGYVIKLWRSPASEAVTVYENDVVANPIFSPDGHTLAATLEPGDGKDARIGLWDITDPATPILRSMSIPHDGASVAFTHGGRVVAATVGNAVHLWNVSDLSRPHHVGEVFADRESVHELAASPNGRTIAVADALRIRLWDISDPSCPRPVGGTLAGHAETLRSLAFSPDGRMLASAADDATIRLWALSGQAGPRAAGILRIGQAAIIRDLIFSPDSRILASRDDHGVVLLWQLDANAVIHRICALTADLLTKESWHMHVGTEVPYTPPCA